MNMVKKTTIIIIALGIVLIIIGIALPTPGTKLTTYSSFTTSALHNPEYSLIDEYVGGDAYNYIIGASLIGGQVAGRMAQKAIISVAGILIAISGVILLSVFSYMESRRKIEEEISCNPNSSLQDADAPVPQSRDTPIAD